MRNRVSLMPRVFGAAVMCASLAVAAAPASSAAPVMRRPVPDSPTVHVPSTGLANGLADLVVAWTKARDGVVAQIPVDTTGFEFVRLGDVNGYDVVAGYGAVSSYKGSARDLILVHGGVTQVIGKTGAPEPLGDRSAFANAVNDDGVVTGVAPCQCRRVPEGVPASVAFRWSATDGFSFAPMPAGVVASTGVAVNSDGLIVVNSWASPDPVDNGAWLWNPDDGTVTKLPDLGLDDATGTAINDDGTIVGYAPSPSNGLNHAVMWGWQPGHPIVELAPSSPESKALDVNEDGTAVGWSGTHAMAWWAMGAHSLDLGEGEAYAINNSDQVVGKQALGHIVPDDGGSAVNVSVPAVYDMWDTSDRRILDVDYLRWWAPVRLNDNGYIVNYDTVFGPTDL